MPDDEALDRVMNPARNRYRLEVLNVSYHSPSMRALHHANYVFEKKLSHTADSQDQRHRMVPASRPLMTFADTANPDYITPRLIASNPRAKAVYDEAMREAWSAKNELLALGVPLEFALYVLPNAKTLRFIESGSLLALLHKWTMRSCFNAQEEIYLATMDEISQVRSAHPRLGRHIGPPCVIRNGLISPRCTEGSHFCGVPVWRDFPNAVRRL
jgi:thymidylate synthase ThyX